MFHSAVSAAPLQKLCVLGAGSWGTALSIALAGRFGTVSLWVHNAENARAMRATRENRRYLPGFALPPNVCIATAWRTLPG